MNRLDRLAAILTQLQTKRTVRAQELADRFGISLRTVYRDVRSLQAGGVPIVGEAGMGYSVMEGWRMAPVHFTRDEVAALLAAGQVMAKLGGAGISANLDSALSKVRSALRLADKDFAEGLDGAVEIRQSGSKTAGFSQKTVLPTILKAISEREALAMSYLGQRDERPQQRVVEPIGVYFRNDLWHLVAHCRLRDDVRNFRLDRIDRLAPIGQFFEPHRFDLQEYLSEDEFGGPLIEAAVTVDSEVVRFVEHQRGRQGFVSETSAGGVTVMRFQTPRLEYLARWMMQFADMVAAVEPPELEAAFRRLLGAGGGRLPKKS